MNDYLIENTYGSRSMHVENIRCNRIPVASDLWLVLANYKKAFIGVEIRGIWAWLFANYAW